MSIGFTNGTHRAQANATQGGRRRTSSGGIALVVLGTLAIALTLRRQRRSVLGALLGPGVPLFAVAALRLTAREVGLRR